MLCYITFQWKGENERDPSVLQFNYTSEGYNMHHNLNIMSCNLKGDKQIVLKIIVYIPL